MSVFTKSFESQNARTGILKTHHGSVQTPVFMPVGTKGTVKAMLPEQLKQMGFEIILGNTYHLHLRPGEKIVQKLGGLHKFMNWDRSILTDSGGYQVFSLSGKVTEDGVKFQSSYDGSEHFITPESSMQIQMDLGSDIIMAFDECTPFPATREQAEKSMMLSMRWAKRSREAMTRKESRFFGIVQGGMYKDLRMSSLDMLASMNCDGLALGGFSVGEPLETMYEIVSELVPKMPAQLPRYLMGVGTPKDLLIAVNSGVDMFDCVIPTRNARNGCLYTSRGVIKIKQARYFEDESPLDPDCHCNTCKHYSKAYLRHLFMNNEILASILHTTHNLHYYNQLMVEIRQAISGGLWPSFYDSKLKQFESHGDSSNIPE